MVNMSCCSENSDHNKKSISSTPQKVLPLFPSSTFSSHSFGGSAMERRSIVSSRWNPTASQLKVLENMYRSGTHTPTTEQIKQITSQLSKFGKIEGKNVFYWFQNHKARERQKCRRKITAKSKENQHNVETNESGLRRNCFEQGKNLAALSNCTIPMEEPITMQRVGMVESNTEIEEWHVVVPYSVTKTTWPVILVPNKQNSTNLEDQCRQIQTLELFPLHSNNGECENEPNIPITILNHNFNPNQFFEFLPLKN